MQNKTKTQVAMFCWNSSSYCSYRNLTSVKLLELQFLELNLIFQAF